MLKTNKSKWIVTLVAFLLIAAVLVGFGVKISQQEKTVTLNSFGYSVGGINSTTGNVFETKKSIYTKNLCNVDGMEIEIGEDATITYKVAFYDKDKEFVSMSDAQNVDFDNANAPETAKYFRVVITPDQVDGEDVTIGTLSIAKYANMLKITYNK